MSELAGKDCAIKISGTATAMVGEATTMSGTNTIYTITAAAKRVLDRTGTIKVHKMSTSFAADTDTTTTTIHCTAHGLVVGDLICNTTRSNAYRLVLTKTNDDFTVAEIVGQVATDTIMRYPTEATTAYTLNRLGGTVTYGSATSRTIKISGNYLPMSTAGYATMGSFNKSVETLDITEFGDTVKTRMAGLLSASGTLTQLDVTDTTYITALNAGLPIVIEHLPVTGGTPIRFWAVLENDEVSGEVAGLSAENVSWISYDEWLN